MLDNKPTQTDSTAIDNIDKRDLTFSRDTWYIAEPRDSEPKPYIVVDSDDKAEVWV